MPSKLTSVDAIIVAGGAGTRLGHATPKAFVPLGEKPMFLHSVRVFSAHPSISNIIIVVPSGMMEQTKRLTGSEKNAKHITVVEGGPQRWQSVQNGVQTSQAQWVLIHDAARPFVSPTVIDAVLEQSGKYSAVITATKEVDTVRRFSGETALETIDRETLIRVGTPQLFEKNVLVKGFIAAQSFKTPPTDEAMLMEHLGIPVGIAWGDPLNFKITTKSDLLLAEALCKRW